MLPGVYARISPIGGRKDYLMLKVVVFDSGYGGELFADYLEEELPILEVIRVIDWRNANQILKSPKFARGAAEKALQPYINKVDLIVFANYLLSLTSLKYFCRKYKSQPFVGLKLNNTKIVNKPTLILATKSLTKTFNYYWFSRQIQAKTIILDDWPTLIDDGELTGHKIRRDLRTYLSQNNGFAPEQIVLGCSQFVDLKSEFIKFFGHNTKIIDGFESALRETCQTLKLRGALKKIK